MGFENIQVKECWRKCGAHLISPLAYVKLHIISVKLQLTGKSSLTYQLKSLLEIEGIAERLFGRVHISLFVCKHHYSKSYSWIVMEFYGGVRGGKRENLLNFGGNLVLLRCANEQKYH